MGQHPVIVAAPAEGGRPAVTYRQAGDRHVLVEYGPSELDLRLNFFAVRAARGLAADPPPGLVEAAPGLRSILIRFAPERTDRHALIDGLHERHDRLPPISSLTVPSRRILLPIAFDDSSTRQAVARYVTTIRHDGPNTCGGNNIDYIVAQNGLPGREALYAAILNAEWWTAFTGFAPGLPFMFSLRSASELSVPKYNPTRAWTPEGAVGIGGPCVAVYPVETLGSYQLFGRTVPIYDVLGCNSAFHHDPFLIRAGNRIRFTRVEEEELLETRRRVVEDHYTYQIEDDLFTVADYPSGGARGGTPHGTGGRPGRPGER